MSQESFHQSGNQELFSVRSQLQKRLMEKVGVNDKNFAETWRAPHYAEDYDLAFKIFLSHHPDVTHEFETDQEMLSVIYNLNSTAFMRAENKLLKNS